MKYLLLSYFKKFQKDFLLCVNWHIEYSITILIHNLNNYILLKKYDKKINLYYCNLIYVYFAQLSLLNYLFKEEEVQLN